MPKPLLPVPVPVAVLPLAPLPEMSPSSPHATTTGTPRSQEKFERRVGHVSDERGPPLGEVRFELPAARGGDESM